MAKVAEKSVIIIFLLIICIGASHADTGSRYVILTGSEMIYVDMGYMDGVREGMRFEVFRMLNGLRVGVAVCEVETAFDYASRLRIISTAKDEKIKLGDLAEVVPIRDGASIIPQPEAIEPATQVENPPQVVQVKSGSNRWLVFGLSLALSGTALYFNQSANREYDKYSQARDPDEISRYRDSYQREINKARIAAGLAGAVFFGYLINSQVGKSEPVSLSVTDAGFGLALDFGALKWFGNRFFSW